MNDSLEKISLAMTRWVGTPVSLVVHTGAFMGAFTLIMFGYSIDDVLLILTTAVSLEAIYLAIFIQMTVNRHAEQIEEVGEDIEDIHEEVEEISEDVEAISEDVEDLQDEQATEETEEAKEQATLQGIHAALQKVLQEVDSLKHR